MIENIKKLLEIVEDKYNIDSQRDWSKGSITYLDELKKEIAEVEEVINSGYKVYLEDELGDVLWDYFNLLVNLENEEKIDLNKVFERVLKKYSQRITGIKEGISWYDIKEKQKLELKKEQEKSNFAN